MGWTRGRTSTHFSFGKAKAPELVRGFKVAVAYLTFWQWLTS